MKACEEHRIKLNVHAIKGEEVKTTDTSADIKAVKAHTVSSKSHRAPKTVSFTVPTLSRPDFAAWRNGSGNHWYFGLLAAVFLVIALVAGFGGAWLEQHGNQTSNLNGSLSNQKRIVTSQSQLINQIAKTVGPSVVSVNVNITAAANSQDIFSPFGFTQPTNEQAAGTGIILSESGIIVTNRHVVPEGTTNVSVTLSDGSELKDVTVLGRTSANDSLDVAFLKIKDAKGHHLTPAAVGDSSKVQVGDAVVAIGNALGQFQNTVTSGIISGYGRSVQAGSGNSLTSNSTENLDDLLQTDAAINEGNSGGPLVNLNGQVIGINTAIAGNSQNIGFAIPLNDLKGLIDQVLKTGKFSRPYLGVRYIPLTADVANQYGLSVNNGAFIAPSADPNISSVIAGGPAAAAGLQNSDIITQLDGKGIDQTHSLTSLLDQHQVGDQVSLSVLRNGQTLHVSVTLGTMPTN